MSSSSNHVCCHRNRHLLVSLLFLLVSSLTHVRFMAEGRSLSRLLEAAQKGNHEEERALVMRNLIGSRPPRCERRCSSCPHCEAIQVPVTTQSQNNRRTRQFSTAIFSISYSRGDDISNYKPMSWKCKCGNLIFNP